MIYDRLRRLLPGPLRRHVLFFEHQAEIAVRDWAAELKPGDRVLDAGAGEGRYAHYFARQRYLGLDLGIGDPLWNYRQLDCIADLAALPLATASCDACLSVVTLEHVREPAIVLAEMARVIRPGGKLLVVAPQDWEIHQEPHDYYRYTRYGLAYLLEKTGFDIREICPVGGFFRLLARRLLNGLQFFPAPVLVLVALVVTLPALLVPLADRWDRNRNFTLGYVVRAVRRGSREAPPL